MAPLYHLGWPHSSALRSREREEGRTACLQSMPFPSELILQVVLAGRWDRSRTAIQMDNAPSSPASGATLSEKENLPPLVNPLSGSICIRNDLSFSGSFLDWNMLGPSRVRDIKVAKWSDLLFVAVRSHSIR